MSIYKLLNQISELSEIVSFNDNNSVRLTIAGNRDFMKNKHYRTSINLVKEVVQLGLLRTLLKQRADCRLFN